MNIEKITENTFDNFKKITPALIAISILTSLILFLPKSILEKMSLNRMPELWNIIIGLIFLFSVSLMGTIIIIALISSMRRTQRNRRLKKNLREKIKILNQKQKDILLELLHSKDKKIELDISSGDTLYLVNNLFLYRPQQVVSIELDNRVYASYAPQPWLMDLYNEEPDLFR